MLVLQPEVRSEVETGQTGDDALFLFFFFYDTKSHKAINDLIPEKH